MNNVTNGKAANNKDVLDFYKRVNDILKYSEKAGVEDIVNGLFYSLEVIPSAFTQRINEIPVLRYFYNRQDIKKRDRKDVFFIFLDIKKLHEWIKNKKIIYKSRFYSFEDEQIAIKEYISNKIIELFQQSEESYFKVISIALNKILEFLYSTFTKLGIIGKYVTYDNFLEVVLALPKSSEQRSTLLNILKNLNFLFILPKEIIDKSLSADVLARAVGIYVQEETNLTVESHNIYRCDNCKLYFVWKEKPKESKRKKQKEDQEPDRKCIFCNSRKVRLILEETYNFTPNLVSYVRVDDVAYGERIYLFSAISDVIGQILDVERTPIVMVPFHSYERKRASPIKKIIPILVSVADVELLETEKQLSEAALKGESKLLEYKDDLEKLKILARSVNSAKEGKLLVEMEYSIISYLIALATSTNRRILLSTSSGKLIDIMGGIKPSINMLVVGEPGSGKSTVKEKICNVFVDRAYAMTMFKYTARQISGYANPQKPKKSVFASMQERLLMFDEASTPREPEIFAVLREILESGKLEDGTTINTAFVFIMNDPLNIDRGSSRLPRDVNMAIRISAEIFKKYGTFSSILSGEYSYMLLVPITYMLTKPFVERMRSFMIVREYGKVYKDFYKLSKEYEELVDKMKKEGKLLELPEIRGLFYKKILPITTIILPEELLPEITKYAEYFALILRKVSEKLQEELEGHDVSAEAITDLSVERIRNSLILLASGIAKLTKFNKAFRLEEYGELAVEITKEDIELAKYFYISFAPDLLHELSIKQLQDIFNHIDLNYEAILSGDYNVIHYDTLNSIALQAKVRQVSILEKTKVKEDIKVVLTLDKMVSLLYNVIKNAAISNVALNYEDVIETEIKKDPIISNKSSDAEKAKKVLKKCIEYLKDRNLITMDEKGNIFDINRILLQKDHLYSHVRVVLSIFKEELSIE
ncbi:MAG: AAA family ATPase [Nanopusillaceae archaeon]